MNLKDWQATIRDERRKKAQEATAMLAAATRKA
jgi:hypothetical protein